MSLHVSHRLESERFLCMCSNTTAGYIVRLRTNCSRGESVRFAYVTCLRVEGKQIHILRERKTLPTQELRQRATKYCSWKIMSKGWTVHASLSATPPASLIPLPLLLTDLECIDCPDYSTAHTYFIIYVELLKNFSHNYNKDFRKK
jgi:hypothetical protein